MQSLHYSVRDDNQDIWLSVEDAAAILGSSLEEVLEAVDHGVIKTRQSETGDIEVRQFDLTAIRS